MRLPRLAIFANRLYEGLRSGLVQRYAHVYMVVTITAVKQWHGCLMLTSQLQYILLVPDTRVTEFLLLNANVASTLVRWEPATTCVGQRDGF